tara:strand:- start:581 stop:976 length:396 start_codon:yes stop_codon:yes gene_type:complete
MANVGSGTSRVIIDPDGEAATVTNNRLDVNATIGTGSSTFTSYPQDTATATAQTITTLIGAQVTTCKEIIIQPDFDNASFIMIGDGGVSTDDTEGIRLSAGETLILAISDTDNVSVRAPDTSQKLNISIVT